MKTLKKGLRLALKVIWWAFKMLLWGYLLVALTTSWFAQLLALITLIIFLKLESNAKFITRIWKHANTLTFGKKRKGKDLLTQKVISQRKREDYWAFIPYGHKYHHIDLIDISVAPNTYEDMIQGTITKIPYELIREKRDIYVSDAGNWFPSQYQHVLNKKYPSMPLYVSLSGHLYDSNVHVNYNGAFGRVWDKIREQADEYFRALGTFRIGGLLFTKIRYYAEYQSAETNVLPFKKKFLSTENNALATQFKATYGMIKDMWIVSRIKKLHYDTRYFKGVFFDIVEDFALEDLNQCETLPSKELSDDLLSDKG